MDWLLRQLARLYQVEVKQLHDLVEYARNDMRQSLEDAFSGAGATWTADDVRFHRRMSELHDRLTRALTLLLLSQSQHYLLTYEAAAYRFGYYATGWQMDAANLHMLHDPDLFTTMAAPYIDATLAQRLFDVQTDFETRARRALVLSQTEGDTLAQAQKRMDDLWGLGKGQNGKSLWFRLLAIADSEFWRAANLGAAAMMGDNAYMLKGKMWITKEDERVCPRCEKLDGVSMLLDADFIDTVGGVKVSNPPLHTLCRCWTSPILTSRYAPMARTERYAAWAVRQQVEPQMDGTGVMA